MPVYSSPGVYIEELRVFPPSIAAVETAIPAFIGPTQQANGPNGEDLTKKPTRITSLLEFEQLFGKAKVKAIEVDVVQTGADVKVTFSTALGLPDDFLYYSMQLFYANGGGPCYVVSTGKEPPAVAQADFTAAIDLLEGFDEPTLLVFPDACRLDDTKHGKVVEHALSHCKKLKDRFAIIDVRDAMPGKTDTNAKVTTNFRDKVAVDVDGLKYGAAYLPYIHTALPWMTADTDVKIKSHKIGTVVGDIVADTTLDTIKGTHTAVYNAVQQFVAAATVTLPPSGGVAGVYARTDADRGVWKAPANATLQSVIEPAVKITEEENGKLNIDATTGKSVNAIRAFVGKGTLVWGGRTLAGNDNENRYVSVRRFLNFVEESIKKAIVAFVFEPNDANTWAKVRSMIESFLVRQWRDGALTGAKPDDAFYVSVGLNKTMTAQDILDGYMIVEIGMAIVRPAEFIVLRFAQMMQKS
ncbi:MAG: phage tail sheath family protein [Planctomycetes bacterium]|nr:phage tail sheath family protein [Planctomycetota bacterium]